MVSPEIAPPEEPSAPAAPPSAGRRREEGARRARGGEEPEREEAQSDEKMNDETPTPSPQPLSAQAVAVCEACGRFIEYWGFKSIHGRVWAYLALSGRPCAQSVVASALGVSKALVNQAISELVSYQLVRQTDERHHAPYEANLDVWPVIVEVLRRREWALIEEARASLSALIESLEALPLAERPFSLERARELLQMSEWAQGLLRLLINARLPQTQERWVSWFSKAMQLSDKIKTFLS